MFASVALFTLTILSATLGTESYLDVFFKIERSDRGVPFAKLLLLIAELGAPICGVDTLLKRGRTPLPVAGGENAADGEVASAGAPRPNKDGGSCSMFLSAEKVTERKPLSTFCNGWPASSRSSIAGGGKWNPAPDVGGVAIILPYCSSWRGSSPNAECDVEIGIAPAVLSSCCGVIRPSTAAVVVNACTVPRCVDVDVKAAGGISISVSSSEADDVADLGDERDDDNTFTLRGLGEAMLAAIWRAKTDSGVRLDPSESFLIFFSRFLPPCKNKNQLP